MSNANWYLRSGLMLLVLGVAMSLLACGGGGNGGVDMNSHNTARVAPDANAGAEVTEGEVGSLPAEMRELLSRPGWNQPFIPPYEGIDMPSPRP